MLGAAMLRPRSRPYLLRYARSLRLRLAPPIIRLTTGDHLEAALTSGRARRGGRRGRPGTPSGPTESRAARRGTRLPECEGRRRPRGPPLRVRRDPRSEGRPPLPRPARGRGARSLRRRRSPLPATRPRAPRRAGARRSPRSVDVVCEERDLDELAHVAISNSRRTSLSEVLRSVDVLRSPTMSAHGSS